MLSAEDDGGSSDCPSVNSPVGSPRQIRSSSKKANLLISCTYFRLWGKRRNNYAEEHLSHEENFPEEEGLTGLRRYNYMELYEATMGFSSERKLGGGAGRGSVYKGFLKEPGINPSKKLTDVAVKRFVMGSTGTWTESQYALEIKLLSRLRHPNLVRMLGWCREKDLFFIVYEFVPNGSLEYYLHPERLLPWEVRYSRIILGLASALLYLQEGFGRCVVHRDVKPSNILLDFHFNPKVTDFEFARFSILDHGDASSVVVGTFGYMAPEYATMGKYGKESDVYAFGVVALELATGRKLTESRLRGEGNLLDWTWKLHEMGEILKAADTRLGREFDDLEMQRLLLVGLWCTQAEPASRPSIRQVFKLLNFEMSMPANMFRQQISNKNNENPQLLRGSRPYFLSGESAGLDDFETVCFRLPAADHPAETREEEYHVENIARSSTSCMDGTVAGTGTTSTSSTNSAKQEEEIQNSEETGAPSATLSLMVQNSTANVIDEEAKAFDTGIPPGYATDGPMREHHRPIINGIVAGLHKMLHDYKVDEPPRFEEVHESIKRYTGFLVSIGAPLEEWSTLAQLVLRAMKQMPPEFFTSPNSEAAVAATLSSLLADIRGCARAVDEDRTELEKANERLFLARESRASLMAFLADLDKQIKEAEGEAKVRDERRAQRQLVLDQKKKHYANVQLFKSVLSKLDSFTLDK